MAGSCLNGVIGFLSTLSLRRATSGSKGRPATQAISIHALLAESDLIDPEIKIATERFLSTLSLRRATQSDKALDARAWISIHALLAESDKEGARMIETEVLFLSTLSLRRATRQAYSPWCKIGISIHALLAESDNRQITARWPAWYFYPRSPCGERRIHRQFQHQNPEFLSTLSLRRATTLLYTLTRCASHFYPRSPCGERRIDKIPN